MTLALLSLAFFLLGSVPNGYWIAKGFCGIDPRQSGSKNIGATNIKRLCGWKWGLLTLILDVAKGVIPVWVTTSYQSEIAVPEILPVSLVPVLAGFLAILGHVYSPFLGGRGGKGVATALGVFLTLVPMPTLLGVLVFFLVLKWFHFVSLGSIVASFSIPLFYLGLEGVSIFGYTQVFDSYILGFLFLTGFLILVSHRENIQRMIRGEELTVNNSRKSS